MKRSTKAVLLSALVLPGVGHFYLKKYLVGAALALCAAISLYVLTSIAITTALDVAQQIEAGQTGLDVTAISDSLSKRPNGSERSANTATNIFVLLWMVGMVDSYRLGRKQDQAMPRH
jgi:hypothetical protein